MLLSNQMEEEVKSDIADNRDRRNDAVSDDRPLHTSSRAVYNNVMNTLSDCRFSTRDAKTLASAKSNGEKVGYRDCLSARQSFTIGRFLPPADL